MGKVLVKMLPLALGAAVNTRVLASQIVLLTGPIRPLAQSVAFGVGAAAPLLVVGFLDLVAVRAATSALSDTQALLASAIVDVIGGAVLLLVAAWLLWRSPSERHLAAPGVETAALRPELARTSLRGAAVMVTDLSTMTMFVAAGKDIVVGGVAALEVAVLFLILLVITLTTAWAPPTLFAIDPALARRVFHPVSTRLRRYGRVIGEALVAAVGVYLVLRGALGLA